MRELKKATPVADTSQQSVIPAYTSEQARTKIEQGRQQFPNDPSKYRRVNLAMDQELVWYKTEIEKRFAKASTQSYIMPRYPDEHMTANQHFAISGSMKNSGFRTGLPLRQGQVSETRELHSYQDKQLSKSGSSQRLRMDPLLVASCKSQSQKHTIQERVESAGKRRPKPREVNVFLSSKAQGPYEVDDLEDSRLSIV